MTGAALWRYPAGSRPGGSQAWPPKRSRRASSLLMPHFAAVDRYDWMRANSASPSRVRQQPPEPRCWTLTGRIVRSASLFDRVVDCS